MRTHRSAKLTIAVALAAALVAGSAKSAPLGTGATQFKTAGAANLEHVRSRGHGGGAVLGGLAAGMILGGIIASQPYYYGGPYYYGPAYPPPPYYYGPGPYGPPDMERLLLLTLSVIRPL